MQVDCDGIWKHREQFKLRCTDLGEYRVVSKAFRLGVSAGNVQWLQLSRGNRKVGSPGRRQAVPRKFKRVPVSDLLRCSSFHEFSGPVRFTPRFSHDRQLMSHD